jgi:hypothetical protein
MFFIMGSATNSSATSLSGKDELVDERPLLSSY